jgi:hypothetical protein
MRSLLPNCPSKRRQLHLEEWGRLAGKHAADERAPGDRADDAVGRGTFPKESRVDGQNLPPTSQIVNFPQRYGFGDGNRVPPAHIKAREGPSTRSGAHAISAVRWLQLPTIAGARRPH